MEKLILVDAYALIYRSYYAFIKSPRINSKGLNTSAIIGFLNTLNEVISKEKPIYIGVAFDYGKTFRHNLFPAYKAQREAQPEDITLSVPIIKEILAAMKIPCLQVEGFEADDVIGTLATKAGALNITTCMLTPDKDFAQLVGENIFFYRLRNGGGYESLDEKAVCEMYDLTSAKQVIDLLALMGDSADNFPGCPGVGPKTATKLIKQFGSVDEMLSRTAEIKDKLRERVEKSVESIRLAKVLATIRTDVPIDLDLAALRVKDADEEKLRTIFNDLEFKSLLNKFAKTPIKPSKTDDIVPDLFTPLEKEPTLPSSTSNVASFEGDLFSAKDIPSQDQSTLPHSYENIKSEEEMSEICQKIAKCKVFSFALQTSEGSAINARIQGISLTSEEGKAYHFAFSDSLVQTREQLKIFRPLFESDNIIKVGHNLKYAIEALRNYDIVVANPLFDTMIAHYLLQPELKHSFVYVVETVLRRQISTLSPKESEQADLSLQLYNHLLPQLSVYGMDNLFYDIEMPLVQVLADMEYNGVLVDTHALSEISAIFAKRIQTIEEEIYQLVGHPFNISSPLQVGKVLFDEIKIVDKPKKTRKGQYVTNEDELRKIASKHTIVRKILDHRALKKLIGTYIDALPQLINVRTGHIHTSFNQTITATGRLSSSDPNIQNIPIRSEEGKEIRKCFVPEDGCLFLSADYSQIELRVMAHLSKDENMIQAFLNKQDIHASTAARVYRKPIENVTREERGKAKRTNFGIIYGITVWGLADLLLIDKQEAKALIEGFFETFPKVKDYMEEAKAIARAKEYAETIFHRRRYLSGILSANSTVRSFSERNAINAPIQGTAADIIKIAMVRIYKRFKEEGLCSKMLLQVHDELNFSVFPEEKERVEAIVKSEMEGACKLSVPLVVDMGWGANWLEAH